MTGLRLVLGSLGLAALGLGCAVGPNFERPVVETPEQYRGEVQVEEWSAPEAPEAPAAIVAPEVAESLADLPWWEVFEDPALQEIIATALERNYDLKIAVARTSEARQQVTATRSGFFPQAGYQGSGRRSEYPIDLLGNSSEKFTSFLGLLSVGWELDVWGKIRRANQAARADLLATEDAQRGVILSLVSRAGTLYFRLIELDAELRIAEEAVIAFQKTLDLFTRKYQGGVASMLEVTRAAAAEAQAQAWVPPIRAEIESLENRLSVLMGRPPGDIARGQKLIEQRVPEVPAGLPSSLLERRPDIREAEQQVVASNAEIGVAIGNFLPRIGLTALWGGSSDNLSDLATGNANVWSVAAEFSGPIFRAGMLWAEYQARVAIWEQAKANYEQTSLRAFSEVSTALVARDLLRDERVARAEQSKQLNESVRLSLVRYNQGLASYFEVLQAQQDLYPALFQLAQTRMAELISVIDLYRALGGGWKLGTAWLPDEAEAQAGSVPLPGPAAPAPPTEAVSPGD